MNTINLPGTKFSIGDEVRLKDDNHPWYRVFAIEDFIYSTKHNDWFVKCYYYNNSIDEGEYTFELQEFEQDFEFFIN